MQTTTVTFGPNENRRCFEIEILNDQLDEGTESFSADIVSVPLDSGVVIGSPDSTIITITDDDGKIEPFTMHELWPCVKYLTLLWESFIAAIIVSNGERNLEPNTLHSGNQATGVKLELWPMCFARWEEIFGQIKLDLTTG